MTIGSEKSANAMRKNLPRARKNSRFSFGKLHSSHY